MDKGPRGPFRPSQETIAIIGVGVALATLMLTSVSELRSDVREDIAQLGTEMRQMRDDARADRQAWQAEARQMRDEARADREAWWEEARADRERFNSEILRLTGEVNTLAAARAEGK